MLRMPKVVHATAERVVQSVVWTAVSRIGVPVILSLVMAGIPAHLLWASRVNQDLAMAQRDIILGATDIKAMKDVAREDQKSEAQVKADLSSMKTSVDAILRAVGRLESQVDRIGDRRQ